MVNDKVIAFLKDNGPSLPVEIGKSISYNSFVTKAILLELINKGLVKKSKRAIGGSLVYYIEGQADLMRQRLYDDLGIPDKKVLDKIKAKGRVKVSDLTPHERAFIKGLLDFIEIEKKDDDYLITHHSYNGEAEKQEKEEPEIKPVEVPRKKEAKLFKNKAKPGSFNARVKEHLSSMGEIISEEKIRKGSEYNYEVKLEDPFPHEVFVKARKRKRLNEKELSMVYAEAMKRKKPAILITTGKLTTRAKEWKNKSVGDMVTIIKLEG